MTKPQRKQLRLPTYDYGKNGLYFITICIQNRKCLLGQIEDHVSIKSDAGKMIKETWHKIPTYNRGVNLHEFTLMPNHIHGIIELYDSSVSIPNIIQTFKSITTHKYINGVHDHNWKTFDKKLWQRNYYEHIIRNEESLNTIQNYIINNPHNWENDTLHT